MTNVSIVIVNWNGRDNTCECLTSLRKLACENTKRTIIVVDNGSSDDSIACIKQKFPDVVLLPQRKNLGFTGGNNIGLSYARTSGSEFMWLLNNDTIVDRLALQAMLDAYKKIPFGIAGSKIYFEQGFEFHKKRYAKKEQGNVLWYAGGVIDWANMYASHRGVDEVDVGQFDDLYEPDFITGCSMFIHHSALEAIGLLDEKYYLYLEDVDYSLRAKRSGFRLLYVPQSQIWHKNAGSTARPGNTLHEYYLTRNRLLIGMKFAPLRTRLALLREAGGFLIAGTPLRKKAVLDAVLYRFGNQYTWQN